MELNVLVIIFLTILLFISGMVITYLKVKRDIEKKLYEQEIYSLRTYITSLNIELGYISKDMVEGSNFNPQVILN